MVKKIGYARGKDNAELKTQIEELRKIGCDDVHFDEPSSGGVNNMPGLSAVLATLGDGDLLVAYSYDCLSEDQEIVDDICLNLGIKGVITIDLLGAKDMNFVKPPSTNN